MNLISCDVCQGHGSNIEQGHGCNGGGTCEDNCPIEIEVCCEKCKGTGLIEGSVDLV